MLPRQGGFPPTVFVDCDRVRLDHKRLQMMPRAKVELRGQRHGSQVLVFPISSHTCCPPCPTKHIRTLR